MYIFGGFQEHPSQFSQDLYMLNLQTMLWSIIKTKGVIPSYRDFHTATAIGNKMYIYGGRGDINAPRQTDSELYCPDIFYLDTTTRMWVCPTVYNHKPPGRRSHSAFVHNGNLYIFGGFNRNLDVHFQDLNRYDPETSTWTKILPKGKPPCPRRRQICLLVNNRVFISGGTSPILPNPTIMRLNTYEESVQNLNQLKDHDDLHVLDLTPSLKDICLIHTWEYIEKYKLCVDDLNIPPSLKNDLSAANPLEKPDIEPVIRQETYENDFPLLITTGQL
jgi:N-acetylneuraminic acid mutarotase